MKTCLQALRMLIVLSVLTGLMYPLAVWAVGQMLFVEAAEGSLLIRDGRLVGSALLAQKTENPRYFQPRPSAADYATVASGASNLAWTSARLTAAVVGRRSESGGVDKPVEMMTASGSGLDPHLSPDGIRAQIDRVAAARSLTADQRRKLEALIAVATEGGKSSPLRVNVLRLNLALDSAFPL